MNCTRLKYVNQYGETFWFRRLGERWPSQPDKFLCQTTPEKKRAKCFATTPEAVLCLESFNGIPALNGQPGWSVEVEDTTDASHAKPAPPTSSQ